MSGFKRSLIGLIVLALLGGYYYFYEVRYQGKKAKEKEISEKIFPVKKSDITKVVYKKGKSTIVLEKKGGGWTVTAPVKTNADEKTVNAFLKAFTGLKSFRKLSDIKWDDPDFGLAKNPVNVTLYDKDGKSYTATFGNSNPTNSYFYTLKGKDKTVLLVWIYPKKLLKETLYDFRFKKVSPVKSDQVVTVHFEKGKEKIDLRRIKKHEWEIVSPIKTKGDRYAIEGFISTATDEKVVRFLDHPPQKPEEFGWEHPRMRISLTWTSEKKGKKGKDEKEAKTGKSEKSTVILVGKNRDDKHVYVKVEGEPSVLVVKNSYLKELDKKIYDFRNKNVWDYEIDDVTRIKYEDKGKNLVIEAKKDEKEDVWKLLKPEKVLADTRAIENWLWDLSGFRVKEFLSRDDFVKRAGASASPVIFFEINTKNRKSPLRLKLYRVKDKWIALGDEPAWYYVLGLKDVEKTFKTAFDLKYRRIVKFEDTDVAKVEVKTEKDSFVFVKKKTLWYKKKGEKEEKIPNIDVLNFLWELSDLKYTKLLKNAPKKSELNPPVRVALFDKDGKSMGKLSFNTTKDGLAFVFSVEGRKEVYWLDRSKTKKFEEAYKKLTEKKAKKEE